MFAERNVFQNLVHSHTKGFEEAGATYPWWRLLVDCRQNPGVRWAMVRNSKVAKFGVFGAGGEGFVRWRWAAADSRSKWGAP